MLQGELPFELVSWLERRQDTVVEKARGTTFAYLGFNMEDPVVSDKAEGVAERGERSRASRAPVVADLCARGERERHKQGAQCTSDQGQFSWAEGPLPASVWRIAAAPVAVHSGLVPTSIRQRS